MDYELILVIGLVIAAFSVPSMISAYSDSRAPRASALTVLIAGGLVIWALREIPGGVRMEDIPDMFIRVIARYVF